MAPAKISDFIGDYDNLRSKHEKDEEYRGKEKTEDKAKEVLLKENNLIKREDPTAAKGKKGKPKAGQAGEEEEPRQPDPSLAQLRQVITEQIAIPLGMGINIEG